MKTQLISLFIIFILSTQGRAQETDKTDIHIFKAKIKKITIIYTKPYSLVYSYKYDDIIKRKNDSILYANIRPRWAIEMEIISIEGKDNILKKDEEITFVIHSPSLDLGESADEAVGKEVNLELHIHHEEDNKVRLSIRHHSKFKDDK